MKHILIVILLAGTYPVLNRFYDLQKRAYEHCRRDNMEVVFSHRTR